MIIFVNTNDKEDKITLATINKPQATSDPPHY